MTLDIRHVCVIGAGTMGSGIAAHLANLGFQVTLLDRRLDKTKADLDRAKAVKPPHFYLPGTADTVRLGGTEQNLEWVADADWVCEAVAEKMEVKRALFSLIEPLLRPNAMVSTNTSGLQIELLMQGRSESFRRRFHGTHFFNPPRFLKLLELIPTTETDAEVVDAMTRFLHDHAGRRVVVAKDTPGFIANRFGMWSMYKATQVAEKLGLTIEQVDEITGPFLGRPRSGSFRLNDLVGLDIMEDIARNVVERCPEDSNINVYSQPESIRALMEKGWIGAKCGQGYYRKEGKELMSLDLKTHAYRQRQEPDLATVKELAKAPLAERLRQGLEKRDEVGEFLREYLVPTLRYADYLKEEISHSVQDFDRVMQWGFGWEAGPFEMLDMIGAEKAGVPGGAFYQGGSQRDWSGQFVLLPPEPEFASITSFPLLDQRETINIRDLGDGVKAVCLTTKMGVLNPKVVDDMTEALEANGIERLVFTSEARSFSAGFDLRFFLDCVNKGDYEAIDQAILRFQKLGLLLGRYPSVAAVYGHCLGGGFEMAMSCSMIAAHPETQIGLPEAKVGLIPGGTGTALMRLRHQTSAKSLVEGIKLLATGAVSTCADQARAAGLLRREDVTVYHPDRLITEAKRLAMTAAKVTHPAWQEIGGPIMGMADQALEELKKAGELTDHDVFIGHRIREVFVKSTSLADAIERERRAFGELSREGLTQARIKAMMETGRPLRN